MVLDVLYPNVKKIKLIGSISIIKDTYMVSINNRLQAYVFSAVYCIRSLLLCDHIQLFFFMHLKLENYRRLTMTEYCI